MSTHVHQLFFNKFDSETKMRDDKGRKLVAPGMSWVTRLSLRLLPMEIGLHPVRWVEVFESEVKRFVYIIYLCLDLASVDNFFPIGNAENELILLPLKIYYSCCQLAFQTHVFTIYSGIMHLYKYPSTDNRYLLVLFAASRQFFFAFHFLGLVLFCLSGRVRVRANSLWPAGPSARTLTATHLEPPI